MAVKILFLFVIVFFALVGTSNAQARSMTGTVIDNPKGMYAWGAIVIKAGGKRYWVNTFCGTCPNIKTDGTIDEIGRKVRIYYTKVRPSSEGYAGELAATRIVEIKKSRK